MLLSKNRIMLLCTILPFFLLNCSTAPKAPDAGFQEEKPPTFQASQVLSPDILIGKNYSIADEVPLERYHYAFTVKSEFGDIPAIGKEVLELRLRELHAIQEAQRRTNDAHFVNGVLQPIKQAGKGIELFFSDPYSSLKNLPKGLGMMLNQYLDAADRRAGSPARRKLAAELDCDPETANPVLKKLLDEMAIQANVGGLLTGVAMSFVPGLSVLTMTADTKDLIAKLPPSEINLQIAAELESLGVGENICYNFIKCQAYTTLQRLLFMEQYRKLTGIQNHNILVAKASEAVQESEALGLIHVIKMFVELDQTKSMMGFQTASGFLVSILGDGSQVIIQPGDYLTYTKDVQGLVGWYRDKYPDHLTVFVFAGQVSNQAKQVFHTAAIKVVENGNLTW